MIRSGVPKPNRFTKQWWEYRWIDVKTFFLRMLGFSDFTLTFDATVGLTGCSVDYNELEDFLYKKLGSDYITTTDKVSRFSTGSDNSGLEIRGVRAKCAYIGFMDKSKLVRILNECGYDAR